MADDTPTELRAVGRLPGGLDIEIRHRRATDGQGPEQMVISLTAAAGFESLGRMLEQTNPMLVWLRMAEATWAPWLSLWAPPAQPLPRRDQGRDQGRDQD